MSEIKFRAWNGSAMEYGGFSVHATSGNIIPSGLGKITKISPLMQFTGLKDKHDKDIYAGDFVKGVGKHDGQSQVFNDYAQWQPFSYLGTHAGEEFEVIGNIHANPELLNGEG